MFVSFGRSFRQDKALGLVDRRYIFTHACNGHPVLIVAGLAVWCSCSASRGKARDMTQLSGLQQHWKGSKTMRLWCRRPTDLPERRGSAETCHTACKPLIASKSLLWYINCRDMQRQAIWSTCFVFSPGIWIDSDNLVLARWSVCATSDTMQAYARLQALIWCWRLQELSFGGSGTANT